MNTSSLLLNFLSSPDKTACMPSESELLKSMRNTVNKISNKTQKVVGLNRHEAENFSNSRILEEIREDENAIEHFQRNLEVLEKELEQVMNRKGIVSLNEKEKEKIWSDIITLAEESLELAERYSKLPKDIGELAIKTKDKDAANTSLIYFIQFGGIIENIAALCEMEVRESVIDKIQGIDRPQDKLRNMESKLKQERRELEVRERMMEQRLKKEGLID